MSKKQPAKAKMDTSALSAAVSGKLPDATKTPSVGIKGPKGVPLTAHVTLIATTNPKRAGTAAYERFAKYENATISFLLDSGITTPDLVYDAAHGYITIEGYTPTKTFVRKERPVKAPKADKAPKTAKTAKGGKVKAAPNPEAAAVAADLEAATNEELID